MARARAPPGRRGTGRFYRIEVRDKAGFSTFRNQDVGDPGHIERLAGRRPDGSWATVTWLVSKDDAHRQGDALVPDTTDALHLFEEFGTPPRRVKGDVFKAPPRRRPPSKG